MKIGPTLVGCDGRERGLISCHDDGVRGRQRDGGRTDNKTMDMIEGGTSLTGVVKYHTTAR